MTKIIAILLLVGCSPAGLRYHRTYQKILAATVAAMTICDVRQTMNVSNGGRWDGVMRETNPLLGERPSAARLMGTAAGSLALLAAFVYIPDEYLPEEIKSILLTNVLVVEGSTVYYNAREVDRGVTWCGRGPPLARLPQQNSPQ